MVLVLFYIDSCNQIQFLDWFDTGSVVESCQQFLVNSLMTVLPRPLPWADRRTSF